MFLRLSPKTEPNLSNLNRASN
ncbi:MAG: hypothetical protein RLZZ171_344, partial [Cyanobacteriota bacterium]